MYIYKVCVCVCVCACVCVFSFLLDLDLDITLFNKLMSKGDWIHLVDKLTFTRETTFVVSCCVYFFLYRTKWRGLIRRGTGEYEAKRISEAEQKRAQRKARAKA